VPGGRIVVIPNADHYVYLSNEAQVVRAMNELLDSLYRTKWQDGRLSSWFAWRSQRDEIVCEDAFQWRAVLTSIGFVPSIVEAKHHGPYRAPSWGRVQP
jgi:hypothetical protein